MTEEIPEKKHSVRGPSGAHRWAKCPGSVVLEAPLKGKENVGIYAAWGSVAHEIAEMCLYDADIEEPHEEPLNAESFEGRMFKSDGHEIEVDMEMADCINDYTAQVHAMIDVAAGDTLLVEQEVEIGHITGEDDGMGTSDVIGITDQGQELVVIDLKTGRGVQVYAEDNEQMLLYALGALDAQTALTFKRVRMVIIQPRLNHVDEWVQDIKDMGVHRKRLVEAGKRVTQADRLDCSGEMGPDDWIKEFLNPGEKQCRFCDASATCPALRDEVIDNVTAGAATEEDFADLDANPESLPKKLAAKIDVPSLDDDELAAAFRSTKLVESWIKSVRSEVEARLFDGVDVPGLGLFIGRRGARKWKSADIAEETLKATRLKHDDYYSKSLVSPIQLEKNISQSNPRIWSRMEELIEQPDGKPTVDHEDCGKQEYVIPGSTADSFDDLDEDDLLS